MDKRAVAIGITIIMVVVIITILKIYNPTDQQDLSNLKLPTPSATWLFSLASSGATPESSQVIGSNAEVTSEPTSTPSPEMLRRGQYLFYAKGCFYCHGIRAEGDIGPQIAQTDLSLELVIYQVYQPEDEMPAFHETAVTESDIAAIYAYLQSLELTTRPQITTDDLDITTGEALYLFFGCFGCHGYRGEGGFGPPLAATTLSLEEVRAQVRNPRERMPAFKPEGISNEELAHIYVFLQNLSSAGETD